MQKSLRTLLLLALALTLGAATAQANLISNGSFENPTTTAVADFLNLPSTSTAIASWTVGSNGIDWIGSLWTSQNGTRSLDMNGNAPGSIAQTFDTTVGQQYQVNFWMAGNPTGNPTIKHMNVTAAIASIDYTFDTFGCSFDDMGWVERSFLFTALNTSTTLTFTSLDNSEAWGTVYGPALDNVSVNAVPLPSAVLLLGSGPLGLAGWRRLRKG